MLRLPPEIRDQIWEYVLGGYTLKAVPVALDTSPRGDYRYVPRITPLFQEAPLDLNRLGTCRQIYSETAFIPYRSNTFFYFRYSHIWYDTKCLKPYQLKQISEITVSVTTRRGLGLSWPTQSIKNIPMLHESNKVRLRYFPNLKCINFLVYESDGSVPGDEERLKETVRDQIRELLSWTQVEVIFSSLPRSELEGYLDLYGSKHVLDA